MSVFKPIPSGKPYQRLDSFPLDASYKHSTLALAKEYAKNNPTAYAGQILFIEDARFDGEISRGEEPYSNLYMITKGKDLLLVTKSLKGYATEEFVHQQVNALVNNAPEALDTLKELADALGNDKDFAATIMNALARKSDIDHRHDDLYAPLVHSHDDLYLRSSFTDDITEYPELGE